MDEKRILQGHTIDTTHVYKTIYYLICSGMYVPKLGKERRGKNANPIHNCQKDTTEEV